MYPDLNVPLWEIPPMGNPNISPIYLFFMGYNPQESLENTINTMGTLLEVHPIIPWYIPGQVAGRCSWIHSSKWLEFEDGGPLVEAMAMRLPTFEIIIVRISCLCPYIFSIHLYPGYANMYIIWYLTVCCYLLYHFSLLWKAKERTHVIFLTWHTWIEKTGHLNAFEFLIWVDIPIP